MEVEIPTIGLFRAGDFERDGSVAYYTRPIEFKGASAELVFYANADGARTTDAQKEVVRRRFRWFEESLDGALVDLPPLLREICDAYEFDLSEVTDERLCDGLTFELIKILPDGSIGCYARHDEVTLDIVLGFSPGMKLVDVHLDG
jgi:hypothetical protein